MFEYAYRTLNIYDDKNYTNYGANHPKLPGVAYFDKHVQPSKDSQVGDVINSVFFCFIPVHVRALGNGEFLENARHDPQNRKHTVGCIRFVRPISSDRLQSVQRQDERLRAKTHLP